MVPTFLGCSGIINSISVKIYRPWKNLEHGKWFNGRKKMYYMNNVVLVDHHGLFIYVNLSYPDLFHDVSSSQALDIYETWRDYFAYDDANQYFKYVFGDSGNVGLEMFIMRQIQSLEMDADIEQQVVDAWKKCIQGIEFK